MELIIGLIVFIFIGIVLWLLATAVRSPFSFLLMLIGLDIFFDDDCEC